MLNKPEINVVVGLGKSGMSNIRYLLQQGKKVVAMDTRQQPPELDHVIQEFPQVALHLGSLDEAILAQAAEIILSPGVSPQEPALVTAQNQGIPIIGDIELFARAAKAPIVAITGTNAKGTVTTLVGEMIQNAQYKVLVGGNIGTPALDLLTEETPDFYVLELSSFQLETTHSLQAAAATILNISEDHLDRHHTMSAYIAAKQRIYHGCHFAIVNREDQNTWPEIPLVRVLSFGLTTPQANEFGILKYDDQSWLSLGAERLLPVDKLLIKGQHNWNNALAALALGTGIGLPLSSMLESLTHFRGLVHRCQWVAEKQGVAWYDDSKGTNVGATLAAIAGLGPALNGKLILIAGGIGKGADFSPLRAPIQKYVRAVILIGKDAPILEQAFNGATTIIHAIDMPEAIALARNAAQLNDAVLLSPACASFDMFRDYEHRGEVFKELVNGL